MDLQLSDIGANAVNALDFFLHDFTHILLEEGQSRELDCLSVCLPVLNHSITLQRTDAGLLGTFLTAASWFALQGTMSTFSTSPLSPFRHQAR